MSHVGTNQKYRGRSEGRRSGVEGASLTVLSGTKFLNLRQTQVTDGLIQLRSTDPSARDRDCFFWFWSHLHYREFGRKVMKSIVFSKFLSCDFSEAVAHLHVRQVRPLAGLVSEFIWG